MNQYSGYNEALTHQQPAASNIRDFPSHVRIPTPPALVALFILCALPGVVGAVLAIIGLVNDRDVALLLMGAYLVLTTLGLYLLVVLPLFAIIQAVHQTIRFRGDRRG